MSVSMMLVHFYPTHNASGVPTVQEAEKDTSPVTLLSTSAANQDANPPTGIEGKKSLKITAQAKNKGTVSNKMIGDRDQTTLESSRDESLASGQVDLDAERAKVEALVTDSGTG